MKVKLVENAGGEKAALLSPSADVHAAMSDELPGDACFADGCDYKPAYYRSQSFFYLPQPKQKCESEKKSNLTHKKQCLYP